MITYKDKTFCSNKDCSKFKNCERALTKEIQKKANAVGLLIMQCKFKEEGCKYEQCN